MLATPLVCVAGAVLVGPENVRVQTVGEGDRGLGPPFPRSDRPRPSVPLTGDAGRCRKVQRLTGLVENALVWIE